MNKISSPLHLNFLLQLLGVVIDGLWGMFFEMIGLLLMAYRDHHSSKLFFKKLILVILIENIADGLGGDHSMIVEMVFFFLEKNKEMMVLFFSISLVIKVVIFLQEGRRQLIQNSFIFHPKCFSRIRFYSFSCKKRKPLNRT